MFGCSRALCAVCGVTWALRACVRTFSSLYLTCLTRLPRLSEARVATDTYNSYKKNLPRRCLFLDFLTASCAPAVQAEAWPLLLARHHPGMLSPRSLCYPLQACEWMMFAARVRSTSHVWLHSGGAQERLPRRAHTRSGAPAGARAAAAVRLDPKISFLLLHAFTGRLAGGRAEVCPLR